jgi:hypothetical protein
MDKHGLVPINARHEKTIRTGCLGRLKFLVHTPAIGSFVRTLSDCMHTNCLLYPVSGDKGRHAKKRLTLRLPVDTIAGVKRAAKRQKKSQADVIDDAVRPVLIAQEFIKKPSKRNNE